MMLARRDGSRAPAGLAGWLACRRLLFVPREINGRRRMKSVLSSVGQYNCLLPQLSERFIATAFLIALCFFNFSSIPAVIVG